MKIELVKNQEKVEEPIIPFVVGDLYAYKHVDVPFEADDLRMLVKTKTNLYIFICLDDGVFAHAVPMTESEARNYANNTYVHLPNARVTVDLGTV